jgi:heme-degrading monooxygenase HmoA
MIARTWRGAATLENAPRYVQHLEGSVFPQLREIDGHRDAYLLQRAAGDRVEFLVVTLWDSLEAVRRFAGDDAETAVVEPQARAVLTDFDATVAHYEVALHP